MNTQVTRTFRFPTAFTILFAVLLIVVGMTWVVPAGLYSKLTYAKQDNEFVITSARGEVSTLPATDASLQSININIKADKFIDGTIKKPISIPKTYVRVDSKPKGIADIPLSMVHGTIEAIDVIVFILVLGGLIGLISKTQAFNAGLMALAQRTKSKEFFVVFSVAILMCLGGTSCGLEEEAVAFYPILVPIFLMLGYDAIVCVGAIFLAASMGTAFSTINPFSVVIASNAAGIVFTEGIWYRVAGLILGFIGVASYLYWYCKKVKADPSFSYTYADREAFYNRYMENFDPKAAIEFTVKRKIILALFVSAFCIMIWGVMFGGWWFPQMAAAFLAITLIIMFISGLSEKDAVDGFMHGASSMVAVSLIIGLARGVNLVMEEGMISDTILYALSTMVEGMPAGLFIIGQLFAFVLLGFVVPSSSGLAVLSMPIMAPLADTVGIDRSAVVSAYNWGQYATLFLAPTGLVLVTLQMLDIPLNKWVKFVLPMVIMLLLIAIALLVLQTEILR